MICTFGLIMFVIILIFSRKTNVYEEVLLPVEVSGFFVSPEGGLPSFPAIFFGLVSGLFSTPFAGTTSLSIGLMMSSLVSLSSSLSISGSYGGGTVFTGNDVCEDRASHSCRVGVC
jgi:hypothetical protein